MRSSLAITPAITLALLFAAPALTAEEAPPPPPIVEAEHPGALGEAMPEDLPEEARRIIEEAEQQPQVTITDRGQSQVEEYRIGGQLFMLRITPDHGQPYYLIDSNGDGELETRRNPHDDPPVAQWPILKW